MHIGQRLRELREAKGLSQRDIEKRTGMLCGYISRIECGHAPPNLATLEKWAKALGLEVYQVFYDGKGDLAAPEVAKGIALDGREQRLLGLFRRLPEGDKNLFLNLAREAVRRRGRQEERRRVN
ncbi:MAG: helix-turn-helix domain-containing protein [Terriglobia bacterium]